MVADKSAQNTPNAPKFIYPNCLPKPKSFGFQWKKASLGVGSPWSRLSLRFNQRDAVVFWKKVMFRNEIRRQAGKFSTTRSIRIPEISKIIWNKEKVVYFQTYWVLTYFIERGQQQFGRMADLPPPVTFSVFDL